MEDYTENIYFKDGAACRRQGVKYEDCPFNVPEIKLLWQSGWKYQDEKEKKIGGKRVHKS